MVYSLSVVEIVLPARPSQRNDHRSYLIDGIRGHQRFGFAERSIGFIKRLAWEGGEASAISGVLSIRRTSVGGRLCF